MAHAGTMHGVIQAEEVALNIANSEQAIDGLVFFRAHLRIVVHMQAERNVQNGAHNGRRVERAVLISERNCAGTSNLTSLPVSYAAL